MGALWKQMRYFSRTTRHCPQENRRLWPNLHLFRGPTDTPINAQKMIRYTITDPGMRVQYAAGMCSDRGESAEKTLSTNSMIRGPEVWKVVASLSSEHRHRRCTMPASLPPPRQSPSPCELRLRCARVCTGERQSARGPGVRERLVTRGRRRLVRGHQADLRPTRGRGANNVGSGRREPRPLDGLRTRGCLDSRTRRV